MKLNSHQHQLNDTQQQHNTNHLNNHLNLNTSHHLKQETSQHTQQHTQQPANQNHNQNSTSNSNTSFLIKDILRYEGQKRKQRKARTAFSDHQLKELEASFEVKRYLTVQDRVELAAKLKLSDTQVKTWYQNRRTKHKRQTAVGLELLNEAGHLYAYQSVLNGPNGQWFFNNYAPNPQLSMAAISAAALIAQRMQLHQSAASATGTSQASPSNPHSPQE